MIPWYSISNLLIAITSLAISLFVFFKGPKTKTNRIWFVLTISIALYGFGAYMVSLSHDAGSAFFWWQVAYIGIIMIPVLFLHFVYSFLGIRHPVVLRVVYSLSFAMWMLDIFRRDLFLGQVSLFFTDSKIFQPGYWVYPASPILIGYILIFFSGIAVVTHVAMIRRYKTADILKRHQIRYFFLGTSLGFLGGGTSFFPCFNISIYPVFNILVVLYPLVTSYAIIKYRLMDASVTITRTGIFIAVYTLVLGLPFVLVAMGKEQLVGLLGANWWIGPLALMAILATGGPFAYIYFQKRAETILLREQRRYQDTLKEVGTEMTRMHNLNQLLNFIVEIIADAVRISHSALYLSEQSGGGLALKASCNLKKGQPGSMAAASVLVEWLRGHKEILIREEIKRKAEEKPGSVFQALVEEMQRFNAAVAVPHFLEDKLLAVLVLGDKHSGRMYTSEDLHIFSVLASQSALAIENALLYGNIEEQVRQRTAELVDVQKQLVQAEKLATVGTLAGGVAHEINNPLTAVLTNVQMLLVDAGKLDADSRESLELIEEATKRCRTIVQKLMVYAKKPQEQTETHRVDLLKSAHNVASFLAYQLEQENIKVTFEEKGDSFCVLGNANEIEQVLTNIILNARDAIKKVKNTGSIAMCFSHDGDWVSMVIKDDGSGIEQEVLSKIFDPFFTTKDVGKGLGLGLSICQSIIEKHKGTITAESKARQGSVFTVRLPKSPALAKEETLNGKEDSRRR